MARNPNSLLLRQLGRRIDGNKLKKLLIFSLLLQNCALSALLFNRLDNKYTRRYRHKVPTTRFLLENPFALPQYYPQSERGINLLPDNGIVFKAMCGLAPAQFNLAFESCRNAIEQPRIYNQEHAYMPNRVGRQTILSTESRFYVFLAFLHFGRYQTVALLFGIDRSVVTREVRHIVPIVVATLTTIRLPDVFTGQDVGDGMKIAAAIDCKAVQCNRVHPGQRQLYRGDKRM